MFPKLLLVSFLIVIAQIGLVSAKGNGLPSKELLAKEKVSF